MDEQRVLLIVEDYVVDRGKDHGPHGVLTIRCGVNVEVFAAVGMSWGSSVSIISFLPLKAYRCYGPIANCRPVYNRVDQFINGPPAYKPARLVIGPSASVKVILKSSLVPRLSTIC